MLPNITIRVSVERLQVLVGLLWFTSGSASRCTTACEWYTVEAVSNAVITIVQELGLKVWLMPCALIPLLPILTDGVELVV